MAKVSATKTAVRGRRTKAEVEAEFEGVRKDVQAAKEAADAKADEAARLKEEELRGAVEGITVEGTVEQITRLGLDVSRALNGITEKLVEEVNRLTALRAAAELERKEIERLHKIDVAASALDQLVEEHAKQKAQFEAEMEAQRSVWEENVRTTERERKEQEEALKKQRQREIDEYEYKKNLERKRAQDKYEEDLRLQEKKNQERQEALEKSWAQREAALKEQEEEVQRLRKEAAEFPARLEKEVQKAVEQAALEAKRAAEQQALVSQKEGEAERRVAALQIKTLEELAGRQSAQIADLQKQVEEAKRQVQEIAVRAIEGASGARALSHINEIAMEQAKHRSSGGA